MLAPGGVVGKCRPGGTRCWPMASPEGKSGTRRIRLLVLGDRGVGKSTLLRLLTSGTVGEGGVGVSELAGDGTVVRIYVGELQIGEHHVVVEFIEPADDDFSVASGLYSQADGEFVGALATALSLEGSVHAVRLVSV